jgi:MFS family permease
MPDVPHSTRGLYRGLPREVAILSAISFTVALGYGIVAPSIPAFARQFGVSTAAAASVISAFALMRVVGALPAGRLADRFGERRTMAVGIGIVAVSSLVAGLSHSFVQLIVLRGVGGLGSAMFGVSAQTLLLRTVRSEQRGRASGLYSGGFLLGSISGPAIGGLVAAWSLRAPFFIYGVMLAIPTLIAFAILRDHPEPPAGLDVAAPDTPVGEASIQALHAPEGVLTGGQVADAPAHSGYESRPGMLAGIGPVLRSRVYQAAAAANLADGFAVLGVRSAIVPLFVHYVLHRSPTWTGIGFGVVAALNAAMLLPAGRVADTIGRRPVIVGGCLLSGVGMLLLAFVPGLGGFLAAMAALGLGSGMLDVAPAAMIGDLLGKRPARKGGDGQRGGAGQQGGDGQQGSDGQQGAETSEEDDAADKQRVGGTVVASFQMAGDIGAVTGPIAVGFLVDSVSYSAAFILAAAILGLAACVGLAAPETRKSAPTNRRVGPPSPPSAEQLDPCEQPGDPCPSQQR